ncbi:MAG: sodium:proton antiporter [Flavobacteriales bacterium]|nr:sodium:proton antiporter [Flavobacteriales bacterium]
MSITNSESLNIRSAYMAIINAMGSDIAITTDNKMINNLLSTSGMAGMLNTIWLIICAMIFGGAMEATGLLRRVAEPIIKYADSTGSLIATTAGTCIFFNITASDQYLAIVVPGRMFADTYKEKGLAPENLSRTLEDSGTVTSVLIPWNTCGATQSAVLGVATFAYLPFCFFNLISPLMTIAYGYFGVKIKKLAQ